MRKRKSASWHYRHHCTLASANCCGISNGFHFFFFSKGTPQDYAEAVRWWKKAADQGEAWAQSCLGLAYDRGQGVPQDYAEAVRWWKRAADQGNADAQNLVGSACYAGKGVPQDYAEAVRWWKRAADQGDAGAQNSLGVAYFTGKGVPQNYVEAYFWGNLAAALGKGGTEKSVASARDHAAAQLSPSELSATQKRCRQWLDAFEKRKAQK